MVRYGRDKTRFCTPKSILKLPEIVKTNLRHQAKGQKNVGFGSPEAGVMRGALPGEWIGVRLGTRRLSNAMRGVVLGRRWTSESFG
jgi:hypothetical protein